MRKSSVEFGMLNAYLSMLKLVSDSSVKVIDFVGSRGSQIQKLLLVKEGIESTEAQDLRKYLRGY